mmetsp:Transcript_84491/g.247822  ORF Transcript_84491/g.247822 Transcript_84491/m.247822 type:complete len:476 (+) Transcript_84491:145-1572(+)
MKDTPASCALNSSAGATAAGAAGVVSVTAAATAALHASGATARGSSDRLRGAALPLLLLLPLLLREALLLAQLDPLQQLAHGGLLLRAQGVEGPGIREVAQAASLLGAPPPPLPLLRTAALAEVGRPEAVALALQRVPAQAPHLGVEVDVLEHAKAGEVLGAEAPELAVVQEHHLVERELVQRPLPLLARRRAVIAEEAGDCRALQRGVLLHGDHCLPEEGRIGLPLAALVHGGPGAAARGRLGDAHQAEEAQEVVVADPAPWQLPQGPADAVRAPPPDAGLPLVGPGADLLHHPARVAGALAALGEDQHQRPGPGRPVLLLLLGLDHEAEHRPGARRPGSGGPEDVRCLPVEVRAGRAAAGGDEDGEGPGPQLRVRGPGRVLLLEAPGRGRPVRELRLGPHEPGAEELAPGGGRVPAVDHELEALDGPRPDRPVAAEAGGLARLHGLALASGELHALRAGLAVEAGLDLLCERR